MRVELLQPGGKHKLSTDRSFIRVSYGFHRSSVREGMLKVCIWSRIKKAPRYFRDALYNYAELSYRCDWIFFSSTDLGAAPTCLSTTWPPLMNRMAGMLVMP